ncbi:putative disease resistance RPP13-like protein 1 [Momordica charantia]|uniref:Disease resistance RPP13-like protein 1 n=1 Tax=Momordica charantia TaxID=3673 RepID=A0A6J1DVZ8_MOMCH|nr:putative disease resistance RPP13-like protein 1 [Momordica charantia]
MALGFIESSSGSKSMEDTGKEYFKELCWRFFFENSSEECNFDSDVNMHDVMRDLTINVAGKKYVHESFNCDYVFREKTRHVSFGYEIKSWSNVLFKLHKAKGLRTFQLFSSNYRLGMYGPMINEAVMDELFSSFPRLRVLGLNNSNIHVVPNSIRKLRHLRYLDISENYMASLPNSITKLQNLQTLNLMNCYRLSQLPRNTSNLVNLRHLGLMGAYRLTHMPKGMVKLSCLQTVSYLVLDCERSNMVSELNVLNYINGELKIIGLEQLRRTPSKASLINLKDKKGLQGLRLNWKPSWDDKEYEAKGDETVIEGLQPHPNVELLIIRGYDGVGLPNWVSTSLSNLTEIGIGKCQRLQYLPQLGNLQALKVLYLGDMRSLKFIHKNEPCSCSSRSFPSLESLSLKEMHNLEGWWEIEETLPIFPRLLSFKIDGCPKLSSMPKIASTGVDVSLCDVGVQLVNTIGPLKSFKRLKLQEIRDLVYLEMGSRQNIDWPIQNFKI